MVYRHLAPTHAAERQSFTNMLCVYRSWRRRRGVMIQWDVLCKHFVEHFVGVFGCNSLIHHDIISFSLTGKFHTFHVKLVVISVRLSMCIHGLFCQVHRKLRPSMGLQLGILERHVYIHIYIYMHYVTRWVCLNLCSNCGHLTN